jgi:hypothetical protein
LQDNIAGYKLKRPLNHERKTKMGQLSFRVTTREPYPHGFWTENSRNGGDSRCPSYHRQKKEVEARHNKKRWESQVGQIQIDCKGCMEKGCKFILPQSVSDKDAVEIWKKVLTESAAG